MIRFQWGGRSEVDFGINSACGGGPVFRSGVRMGLEDGGCWRLPLLRLLLLLFDVVGIMDEEDGNPELPGDPELVGLIMSLQLPSLSTTPRLGSMSENSGLTEG